MSSSLAWLLSCPWPCAAVSQQQTQQSNPQNRLFAQALCGSNKIGNTNLPVPTIKGDRKCNKIDQEEYEKCITDCQRNLWGRLVLNKGDKPYTVRDLNLKLTKLWHTPGKWRLISLGIGFFEFHFDNYDDMFMVWAKGTINLVSGVLRLSKLTKDFNWYTQQHTHAQVWFKIMELQQ
jgi:hypothetical protein